MRDAHMMMDLGHVSDFELADLFDAYCNMGLITKTAICLGAEIARREKLSCNVRRPIGRVAALI